MWYIFTGRGNSDAFPIHPYFLCESRGRKGVLLCGGWGSQGERGFPMTGAGDTKGKFCEWSVHDRHVKTTADRKFTQLLSPAPEFLKWLAYLTMHETRSTSLLSIRCFHDSPWLHCVNGRRIICFLLALLEKGLVRNRSCD